MARVTIILEDVEGDRIVVECKSEPGADIDTSKWSAAQNTAQTCMEMVLSSGDGIPFMQQNTSEMM